jgi:hypothetical protein
MIRAMDDERTTRIVMIAIILVFAFMLVVLFLHRHQLPPTIGSILRSA